MADVSTPRVGWTVVIAVSISVFVIATDQVMLPVGAPAIAGELGTTVGGIQAAIAFVSLVAAPLYIAGGRLGDKLGKKRVLLVGLVFYAIGALGAALAPTFGFFLASWSVVRAVGMVLVIPTGVGLLIATYDPAERGRAFSIYGVGGVAAALIAPLMMGFFAQQLSWRLAFAVVAVLVAVSFALSLRAAETERDRSLRVDWSGTAVLGLAIASFIVAGMLGTRYGWWEARRPFELGGVALNPFGLSPAPWLLLIGTVIVVTALPWFARRAATGGSPLFDPALFRNRTYAPAFPMAALLFLLSGAIPFTVPVFLQSGVGFDATTAGLVIVVFSIGSMLLGLSSGALLQRLTPRPLLQLTIVVLAVGLGWLAFAVEPDVTFWSIAAPMAVVGAAFGVISSQAPNIQMSALEPHQVGEGSGVAEVGKEIGIGLGTAVVGGILLSSSLTAAVGGLLRSAEIDLTAAEREQIVLSVEDLGGVDALAEAPLPDDLRAELQRILPAAYSDGMRLAIGAMFLVVVLALVAASLLPDIESEAVDDEQTSRPVADISARRT